MNIYDEAISDIRTIKEHATRTALSEIAKRIEPKVREFVDANLFESVDDDALAAIDELSGPDVVDEGEDVLEVSDDGCKTIAESIGTTSLVDLYKVIAEIASINSTKNVSQEYISQQVAKVSNMYEHVHSGGLSLPTTEATRLCEQLESCNKKLHALRGIKESEMKKKPINEADISIKLTGLPDDLLEDPDFLDKLNVELTQEEDEDGDEGADSLEPSDSDGDELDLSGGDEDAPAGDEAGGDTLDFGDLDMGGDEGEEDKNKNEADMNDDTVIEIDEGVLRREIARMKALREGAPAKIPAPPPVGKPGHTPAVKKDFGGGSEVGEPFLDSDSWTGMDDRASMKEGDELDEADEEEPGVIASQMVKEHRRLSQKLSTLQERYNAARARGYKTTCKVIKETYGKTKSRLAEVTNRLNEAKRAGSAKPAAPQRSNSADSRRLAEAMTDNKNLRKQLSVANTLNAKLGYGIKLLQNESLSKRQKSHILGSLDEAKSASEAKLVYESLTKTLNDSDEGSSLNEGATRRGTGAGSSSGAKRPGATLSEGYDAARWAKLAGL